MLTAFSLLSACLHQPPPVLQSSFSLLSLAGKIVLTVCKIWICFYFTMPCFLAWQILQIHGQVTWGWTRGRFFQMSFASWWSCHIQNAVMCSTFALPRTPPAFLSLAYRGTSLTWKCLNPGSNIPSLCSDLASPLSLSSALLRGSVTLPSTNLLQCTENLLRNCALCFHMP